MNHNLSHQQLAMYHTAKDLYHMPMGDEHVFETKRDLVDQKLGESVKSGLLNSIKKQGVQKPVEIYHEDGTNEKWLEDGHHRVIAAHEVNPNMLVPVEHT